MKSNMVHIAYLAFRFFEKPNKQTLFILLWMSVSQYLCLLLIPALLVWSFSIFITGKLVQNSKNVLCWHAKNIILLRESLTSAHFSNFFTWLSGSVTCMHVFNPLWIQMTSTICWFQYFWAFMELKLWWLSTALCEICFQLKVVKCTTQKMKMMQYMTAYSVRMLWRSWQHHQFRYTRRIY